MVVLTATIFPQILLCNKNTRQCSKLLVLSYLHLLRVTTAAYVPILSVAQ